MMTIESHCKGLKKIHSKIKDIKEEDINKMSQEEYDRELVDIGLQLIRLDNEEKESEMAFTTGGAKEKYVCQIEGKTQHN